ncbi:hypothetical protein AOLI_G00010780 [Acnodon oligacanthus]
MRGGIEAIDPRPAISPALLASVKALLEGDGFCRLKHWINGAGATAGPSTAAGPLGRASSDGSRTLGYGGRPYLFISPDAVLLVAHYKSRHGKKLKKRIAAAANRSLDTAIGLKLRSNSVKPFSHFHPCFSRPTYSAV